MQELSAFAIGLNLVYSLQKKGRELLRFDFSSIFV